MNGIDISRVYDRAHKNHRPARGQDGSPAPHREGSGKSINAANKPIFSVGEEDSDLFENPKKISNTYNSQLKSSVLAGQIRVVQHMFKLPKQKRHTIPTSPSHMR
ncbi:hypothetical protein GOP47_0019368 [Adiantum capillus-veneris]|uniref:Uncharacterized protein n=1 Tax=Adiantum capillus-veneris TaxID=13818 RepID=A0A9D4Z704_ADICA|nr:hypothetical protein GOP47_0019368 [Adiantum capillus-veneris]